jgi:hypothetical protein
MSKTKRTYPKAGERVDICYGKDADGRWWWVSDWNSIGLCGPFATRKQAEKDSEVTIFGPQCEFKHGGRWDPAWDQKQ